MSEFSAEDYLRILAERMKAELTRQPKKGNEKREEFVYASEEVVIDPGEIQSEVVPCPK